MLYSYFPGCTMESTGVEYAKSIRYVNTRIGLRFAEIKGWNCCGATAGHNISSELGAALPARNIALAGYQRPGVPIVVACASCYSRLKCAQHAVETNKEKMERLTEMEFKGNLEIVSILEAYSEDDAQKVIKSAIRKTLSGMKVACYYGCLFARPARLTGMTDPENPLSMDGLIRLAGAEPIDWAFKTECCGAGRHVDMPKAAKPLLRNIFRNAAENGAEAIVTGCPMCMMNLDMREREINKAFGESFDIPVYYFTELLAAAMGADMKESGIKTHFYPATGLIEKHLADREVR